MVRRIKINEVARTSRCFPKIAQRDFNALKRKVARTQIVMLANGRILRTAHRHIELAFGVHAPKAVVAGLVEVDETRRYLDAVVEIVLTSEVVVVFLAVLLGVNPELGDERFGVALDDLIGVDEIKINIT